MKQKPSKSRIKTHTFINNFLIYLWINRCCHSPRLIFPQLNGCSWAHAHSTAQPSYCLFPALPSGDSSSCLHQPLVPLAPRHLHLQWDVLTSQVPRHMVFSQLPHFAGSEGLTQSQTVWQTKVFFLFSILTDQSTDNNHISSSYFLSSLSCDRPTQVAQPSSLEAALTPQVTLAPTMESLGETRPRSSLGEFVPSLGVVPTSFLANLPSPT